MKNIRTYIVGGEIVIECDCGLYISFKGFKQEQTCPKCGRISYLTVVIRKRKDK